MADEEEAPPPLRELSVAAADHDDEDEDDDDEEEEEEEGTPSYKSVATTQLHTANLPRPSDGTFSRPTLGLAKSTQDGRKIAIKTMNTYFELVGRPLFQNLTDAYVANDNLEHLMEEIVGFLVSNPLPHDFGKGFAPKESNSKKMWMEDSLFQVISGIKNCLREKFRNHPTWPQSRSDNPVWYTELVKLGKKEWKRNYKEKWKNDPDLVFGGAKIMPVYR